MKIKHVVASVALSFAMGFGALAGLMASKEAKAAKADDPKTWMDCINVNLHEMVDYSGFDGSSVVVWTWKGDDKEHKKEFSMHQSGIASVYTVNATFEEAYEFNKVQFKYVQGGENKESFVYPLVNNQNALAHEGSITAASFQENSQTKWTEDSDHVYRWELTVNTYDEPFIKIGSTTISLNENVEAAEFYETDIEVDVSEGPVYLNVHFAYAWRGPSIMTDSSEALFNYPAENGSEFKESGTYDFFLTNNYHDGGILEIKKHDSVDSYIYYLSEGNFGDDETPNSIYTFGGAEQFGAWSGSEIATVGTEVTHHGALRFDGVYGPYNDQSQYIYKIPVKIGYPDGDSKVIFNYNGSSQGAEQDLVAGCAYKWNSRNENFGKALDFLLKVEEKRHGVAEGTYKQYSVCGISQEDAQTLYGEYQTICSESIAVRNAINDSFIYTYNEDKSAGNEMVPLTHVMERIGIIAGLVEDPNASRFGNIAILADNKAIVIISIAASTALAFTFFFIFKKKKHQ